MNNYSLSAKLEIASTVQETDAERRAFLSALVHTCASVVFSNSGLKVEINADNETLQRKVSELISYFYDTQPVKVSATRLAVEGDTASVMLFHLAIFAKSENETSIVSGIAPELIPTEQDMTAYVRGAFAGSGSVSLKSGYRLEFLLSNADLASHVSAILEQFGINNKIMLHNEKYVVYIKDSEKVSDCLALLGANKAVIQLNNEIAIRDVRKHSARIRNCDVANINKCTEASRVQREAIAVIEKKLGLSALNPKLREMAQARKEYDLDTFAELADRLNLPKSTVKNRLNKLIEIAQNLKEKE